MMTYLLGRDPHGGEYIECQRCRRRSYHPRDIAERYCANCHYFFEKGSNEVSTIPIPTQEDMENFFDLLTRLRTDSRLLANIIENNWGIQPPPHAGAEWLVFVEDASTETNVLAADPDLRKTLLLAEKVAQEMKKEAEAPK